jgi:TonB family protein
MNGFLLSVVLIAAGQGAVVPMRWSRPAYPAIAASARVAGEVEVVIEVRSDGSIESAMVVSGSPLLSGAALEAARSSHFECRGCSEATMAYSIVFSFQLEGTPDLVVGGQGEIVNVSPSQSRVTIVGETAIVGGIVYSHIVFRSAKCLWLWKCGYR